MSFTPDKLFDRRYRLKKILGRGGFGRTYLAEDTGRFNELCALKEIIPDRSSPDILAKSRELFQREGATLYHLQHPQIPQFRATFEEEGSWFLVQDYIEGKTLRELLRLRLAMGERFGEGEVRQLLEQILPVLDYLHAQGIVHRDISPENIIVREGDGLPVLIDFGVVKELVTLIQSPHRPQGATAVGKVGYSPSEQFQRGEAYPSSDLYSLAATMVVLMTGREPRDLFDEENLAWDWRQWIEISEPLGTVLQKMLSQRPSDRYASVTSVLQALQGDFVPTQPPPAEFSQVATVAVGGNPPPKTAQTLAAQQPAIPQPSKRRFDPLLLLVMTLAISLVTGVGSWGLVTWWLRSRSLQDEETVISTPSPLPSPSPPSSPFPTPSPSPTPSPTADPPQLTERSIVISTGQPFTERYGLDKREDRVRYRFLGQQGQTLEAIARSGGVWMTIFNPRGQILSTDTKDIQSWQGQLSETGEYAIELSAIPNVSRNNYRYRLTLVLNDPEPPAPEPTPEPTPEPAPEPEPTPSPAAIPDPIFTPDPLPEPVFTPEPFPSPDASPTPPVSPVPPVSPAPDPPTLPSPSSTPPQATEPRYDVEPVEVSANVEGSRIQLFGTTSPDRVKRYLVFVEQGQTLSAEMQSGRATMNIRYPDGRLMDEAEKVVLWEVEASRSGDYQIDIVAAEATDFAVDVRVRVSQ